jgi:uncharacterized protein (TIGR02452 family)
MSTNFFNPVDWINDFKIASKNRVGFRELRAEIFKQNIQVVKQESYSLNGNVVEIPNDDVIVDTVYFDKPEPLNPSKDSFKTKFSVIEADCIETAELLQKTGYKVCVLNMANRQKPGGGVLGGAGAQEENIFRRTNLFLSLYQFVNFSNEYGIERHTKSYPLNRDTGGIYSKDVTVFRGSEKNGYCFLKHPFKLSFVSVPAINKPELIKVNGEYQITNSLVEPTKEKIRTILRIGGKYNHDCLVLSAFGCGAFCNPPKHVAKLFKEVLQEKEFASRFKMIVYSILDDHNSWKEHNPEGNTLPFAREFDTNLA